MGSQLYLLHGTTTENVNIIIRLHSAYWLQRNCTACDAAQRTTTIVIRPFVRDYPGEPALEETFTHPPS